MPNQRQIERRVKVGGFREFKTLDEFDFAFNASIKRTVIFDLAAGRFLPARAKCSLTRRGSPRQASGSDLIRAIVVAR